jgi:hypothetical protein
MNPHDNVEESQIISEDVGIVEELAQIILEDVGIDTWFLEDFIPERSTVEVEMVSNTDTDEFVDNDLMDVYNAMKKDAE